MNNTHNARFSSVMFTLVSFSDKFILISTIKYKMSFHIFRESSGNKEVFLLTKVSDRSASISNLMYMGPGHFVRPRNQLVHVVVIFSSACFHPNTTA